MPTVSLNMLDQVRIASPCPVRWDDMHGDDRLRRCDECNLNVHNISGLSRSEAEAFLRRAADVSARGLRVCVGYWRRPDGTILTRDCPVGLAAARAAVARRLSRVTAVLGLVFAAAVTLGRGRSHGASDGSLSEVEPFSAIARALNPVAPFLGPMAKPTQFIWTAGDVCLTPSPSSPTAPGATTTGN